MGTRMHRSAWSRALTTVWGLWFALALVEPMAVHPCPTHDAMPAMAGMAMHGMHVPAPAKHGSHACTCMGECCVAALTLPARPVSLATGRVSTVDATPQARIEWPRPRRAHADYFANGPPTA
jgi:hypothetical protein